MKIIEKIRTLLWYLRRPKNYRQLIRLIKFKLLPHKKESSRSEATSISARLAISTKEAIVKITGSKVIKLDEIYPEIFKEASRKQAEVPVKMGGGGNIGLLYNICEFLKATKVLETGVAYGWSSLSLLLSLKNRPDSVLVSTDMPYAKLGNESYVGCLVPAHLRSKWTIIKQPDVDSIPIGLKQLGEMDLCHYDSDKSYFGKSWAYPLLWNALKQDGIFISDDIGDNLAFFDFAEQINRKPIVVKLGNQFIGVIIKN